jgi:hypothetical protein
VLTHESNRESGAPSRSSENWILRFGKPDDPVLSILAVVRCTAGVNEGALPTAK